MKKRPLGNTDLSVYPVTFGGNVFGWTIDQDKSFEILDGFISAGFNFIDTADSYSHWAAGNKGGESETILGNWMKSRKNRDQIVLATKVGSIPGSDKKSLAPNYITKCVEASLRRLKTDYIDLYQSHYDDLSTPIEQTLETYDRLIGEGKVRWVGASNFSAQRLKIALEIANNSNLPRYQTFQPEYNLYNRSTYEEDFEQLVLDNNLGVLNYYSLASGFLTGKYQSAADLHKSQRGPGIKAYLNERGFRILTALDEVSKRHNANPACIALAWLIARPSITAPIASVTSLEQLKDMIDAASLRLTNEDIIILDKASS